MMDWKAAWKKYAVADIGGFMRQEQCEWLYKQAAGLPAGSTALEIGVLLGRGTTCILAGMAESGNGASLICVDRFALWDKDSPWHDQRRRFDENITSRGLPMPTVIAGNSNLPETATPVADGSLSWIFIDGCHSLLSVQLDIAAWAPKLAPDGLMSGHDSQLDTVVQAVTEAYGSMDIPQDGMWTVGSRDDG